MGLGSGTAGNILYEDCKVFGLERFHGWEAQTGYVDTERIVIVSKPISSGIIRNTSFIEVNFLVPNLPDGSKNKIRLDELEDSIPDILERTGTCNGYNYYYSCVRTGQENEPELKCSYVNARIEFKVINVKK